MLGDFYGLGGSSTSPGGDAARQSAAEAKDAVRDLEERVNQLTLINMALWSLLKEITDLTDEDLMQRVREIDLQDGQVDGKVRGGMNRCPRCGQTLSKKHHRCLHCGY
ncbi:MAG: hypothetical protein M3347_13330 [Armatimonadota bacterium]|nr:hypothetical protein [Armatimonadota bacterium]